MYDKFAAIYFDIFDLTIVDILRMLYTLLLLTEEANFIKHEKGKRR